MQLNCVLSIKFSKASGKPPHPFERKSELSILVLKKKGLISYLFPAMLLSKFYLFTIFPCVILKSCDI